MLSDSPLPSSPRRWLIAKLGRCFSYVALPRQASASDIPNALVTIREQEDLAPGTPLQVQEVCEQPYVRTYEDAIELAEDVGDWQVAS